MTDVLKYDKPLTNGRGPWRLITRTNQVSPSGCYITVGTNWEENLNLIERNRSRNSKPPAQSTWKDHDVTTDWHPVVWRVRARAQQIILYLYVTFSINGWHNTLFYNKILKQWKHCELCWKWEWDHISAKCKINPLPLSAATI